MAVFPPGKSITNTLKKAIRLPKLVKINEIGTAFRKRWRECYFLRRTKFRYKTAEDICPRRFSFSQGQKKLLPLGRQLAEVGFQDDMRRNAGMRDAVEPREFLLKVQDGTNGGFIVFQIGVCPLE